jgi:hypothetical protein
MREEGSGDAEHNDPDANDSLCRKNTNMRDTAGRTYLD